MRTNLLDARTVFNEKLPQTLAASPASFRYNAVYVFNVKGRGGGQWTLDLKSDSPSCTEGANAPADCTIEISVDDLGTVLSGTQKLEELFFRQKLKVTGDLGKAAALRQVFAQIAAPLAVVGGLSALLTPFSSEQFRKEHWPSSHLLVEGPASRLQGLADLPELADVYTLLRNWRGMVRVFPPGDQDYQSPYVLAEAAEQLYRKGFTLVFSSVDLAIPALRTYLRALQSDLGFLPNVWGRCMVYATPRGGGFNPHFDENANFAVQLRGEKVWQIAPNRQVVNPTVSHLMSAPSPVAELRAQVEGDFPKTMPPESETITLNPGSVLFLPRAYWHSTRDAVDEALSINFTFSQPTWADVLSDGIRSRLLGDPKWRALAYGDGANVSEQAASIEGRLAELMVELFDELKGLTSAEISAGVRPHLPSEFDALDLKRDWVGVLSPLGFSGEPVTVVGDSEQPAEV
jgi:50S ribosomal protein L16 3-hydroxylase